MKNKPTSLLVVSLDAPTFMWQTGGPPALHRITIVKLLTQHVVKRCLGTHQWQSALLVVGLPVTKDWLEMGCHLSPSLISIRLTTCRTSIPRKRRGNHKQTSTIIKCALVTLSHRLTCLIGLHIKAIVVFRTEPRHDLALQPNNKTFINRLANQELIIPVSVI